MLAETPHKPSGRRWQAAPAARAARGANRNPRFAVRRGRTRLRFPTSEYHRTKAKGPKRSLEPFVFVRWWRRRLPNMASGAAWLLEINVGKGICYPHSYPRKCSLGSSAGEHPIVVDAHDCASGGSDRMRISYALSSLDQPAQLAAGSVRQWTSCVMPAQRAYPEIRVTAVTPVTSSVHAGCSVTGGVTGPRNAVT